MPNPFNAMPTILSIAGSDPSGGAGIQTDLKTIHALHGYALTVPTVLTVQNSQGVIDSQAIATDFISKQLKALSDDMQIDAVKIGMLGNSAIIEEVATWLNLQPQIPVILDPIIQSSSGHLLLDVEAIEILKEKLFPLVDLITPNLPELNLLIGQTFSGYEQEIAHIQEQLQILKWPNTLLKGGHSDEQQAIDYLFLQGQNATPQSFVSERLKVQHDHGTGCTLSSAIATEIAKGENWSNAIRNAKDFLFKALQNADKAQPGYHPLKEGCQRHGGLNHFFQQSTTKSDI